MLALPRFNGLLILLISVLTLFGQLNVYAQKEEDDNKFTSNKNKPEREEWLRDMGFGLFIHFSFDSQLGISISHSMVGASDDYMNRFINELSKTFDPYKYDAYRMAMQAKLAGARYICITAKHHSGYCLWDTETTDFKITNSAYKKDLIKEYVDGARKAGLAVGIYYSPEDFKFLYDHGVTVSRATGKLPQKIEDAYNDLVRKQTRELFTRYGKIDMLFIDGNHKEACKEEAWKLQPDVVITRGAVNTPEQTIPGAGADKLWESNLTMGTQWEYKPTNDDLKSGTRLIEILIETRAKGGNMLLNVGPKPDGTIADPEERRLQEIATWHFINQEAIHNVRTWIIPNEEYIWFTASKNRKTVYAMITGLPDWFKGQRKDFVISSVKTTPNTKISVLGYSGKTFESAGNRDPKCYFTQQADGIHISVVNGQRIYDNNKWPNPITVKLENIEPALIPPVLQTLKPGTENNQTVFKGKILDKGDAKSLNVCFEYRLYPGFFENLYFKEWKRTEVLPMNDKGEFSYTVQGLQKGKTYEYRFVVIHPKITLYGDREQATAK
ncbi:alpha-L-fucosidase [Mucilaginibacter sp. RS28]|uniref:alpha-L-fucosidase n=1 Tax=Mucilaginibacter straminoryzae TaxID=2932774 RepID=A0A9X2B8S2_9SPHI|nr:alpha-L-fucosidase [Mucilaginibacter straminoryzae]MCJ8208995.1 alpha-L-fucosidase [Mucilaginibacter straminoryzae]